MCGDSDDKSAEFVGHAVVRKEERHHIGEASFVPRVLHIGGWSGTELPGFRNYAANICSNDCGGQCLLVCPVEGQTNCSFGERTDNDRSAARAVRAVVYARLQPAVQIGHHRLQACHHYWPALALLEDGVATTVC
jgi:hypothetical protein